MLKFFKKSVVENSKELAETMVMLPESKKEMSVSDAITLADKAAVQNAQGYCNPDHLVKVGNDEFSVGDLVNRHLDMMKKNAEMEEMSKKNAEDKKGDEKKENEDKADKKAEEKKENEEDKKDDEKKENEEDKEEKKEDKKENSKDPSELHFNSLANAHLKPLKNEPKILELSKDRMARGKARYGSK